jgi:hypothetical protein
MLQVLSMTEEDGGGTSLRNVGTRTLHYKGFKNSEDQHCSDIRLENLKKRIQICCLG